MEWYYVENASKVGPITEAELVRLFQSGKINIDTLVWTDGMSDWAPCQQAMAQAKAPPALQPQRGAGQKSQFGSENVCAECGRRFPPDELVTLNRTQICAACKPVFLQRMAEGAPTVGSAGIWREGKKLVTRSETPFPDRCVKCNAPANGFRLKRVLYWMHPAWYLLIVGSLLFLCSLLVVLIVFLVVRKKAVVHVGLCEAHRRERRIALIVCTTGTLGGLVMVFLGMISVTSRPILYENGWLIMLFGVLLMLAGLIWGTVKGRIITATKIDKEQVWISGVCRAFLDQLPER